MQILELSKNQNLLNLSAVCLRKRMLENSSQCNDVVVFSERVLVYRCFSVLIKGVLHRKPTPYHTSVCCSPIPLLPSCFQNTALECKLSAAGAGDKSFDKSPTKSRQPRKVDLRARYWAFLFDNLRRAVDEIYVTCESDQSVVECKVRLQLLLACPAFLCFRKTN